MARQVLNDNWTGSYTKPSPGLYPHQWNWDSGFIAIGYAHYDQERAQTELKSLFGAQWPNGMVPQIVFNPQALGNYFPEPDFWQVPGGRMTSGITMPPLHATACLHIYQHAKGGDRVRDFLKAMYPKLLDSHRYFYRHRDPDQTGLVYVRHPWESGLDNSPTWDDPLDSIEIDRKTLPPYERKDLRQGIPRDQRPSDAHYDRYIYLVDLFRRNQYDEKSIYEKCPFLIQDPLFNSILARANRDLLEIGKILKMDTGEVEDWTEQTARAISRDLWCEECDKFEAYDLVRRGFIHSPTVATFMPLFGRAASPSQAERLYVYLDSIGFCALHQGNCFTVPTHDMTEEGYDPQNYWRGPIWININWMLSRGLQAYGYREKADTMKKDLAQLPIRFGFHEYFDSRSGEGYGSKLFSWTAALFIDLISDYYEEDKHRYSRSLRSLHPLNAEDGVITAPVVDIASRLMTSLWDLKLKFFDVNRGRVDYESMRRSSEYQEYKGTAAQLKHFDLRQLVTREQRLAFWINLYNVLVVHGIAELGITASVREVSGFFRNLSYQIGEFNFSPDDIEHGILRANSRPPYGLFSLFMRGDRRRRFSLSEVDPRIHFALVCGSRSCAPIRFYDADHIDEQLNLAAKNFVNSSEVIILPEKHTIFLSQIFRWYRGDFGGKSGVFRFLLSYLNRDEKSFFLERNLDRIRIEYLFYDWNLNR
ncbi:MAG: DUF547 domain-containing protein [Proteobacteria bacterium]|nr:DUF547 domain-containing protein [Pseudomonadota bacterium]NIS72005.1 DUF547 domain-containing protein [Pseudomonadota bacterium]